MGIADYLGHTIQCECGKQHTVEIQTVEISRGALEEVADILKKDGFKYPFVVSDQNTYRAAGQRLVAQLEEQGITVGSHMFRTEGDLVPDEEAVGELLLNFEPGCDVIVGVGSGTINDLVRFFSHRVGLPYYIAATAPSMDGYASTGAALIVNRLKTTYTCQMPRAIVADLDVLSTAPKEMLAAGFCDVVGKYTALADWRLSAIINDEYYCDRVVDIMRTSLEQTVALKDDIAEGKPDAVGKLMEALVLAGISMSYAGNSRPASGSEHHLSHFWEIRFLLESKPALLHGTKVGIGTVLITRLYQLLQGAGLNSESIRQVSCPQRENWEEEIHRTYLAAAPEVIALEESAQKNDLRNWEQRIRVIAERWPQILAVLDSVPSDHEIETLLTTAGGVVNPAEVGISADLVRQALIYAKEVRPRYTILQLLWDLNLLVPYAERLTG